MSLNASFLKRTFHFSFNARTSRGAMKQRDSWFLKVWDEKDPTVFGLGEAGPLPGLSAEKPADVERQLREVIGLISKMANINGLDSLQAIHDVFKSLTLSPSVTMATETALLDLNNGGKRVIFQNDFVKAKPISINGLVWMGGLDVMLQQISIKIDEGFSCIKMKVGGLNFEKEMDILQFIRRKYFRDVITIRLDANGAFKADQALYKLMDLSRQEIHSIEQPLKAGSPYLPELCRKTAIPIALDEEMIGTKNRQEKSELLDRIQPQFITLKPSLHGGLLACQDWIALAEERKIGWWLTSALESSIGLNAIAQFTSNYAVSIPQGLGTGTIFKDNIPSPLEVKKGCLFNNSQENWDLSEFN